MAIVGRFAFCVKRRSALIQNTKDLPIDRFQKRHIIEAMQVTIFIRTTSNPEADKALITRVHDLFFKKSIGDHESSGLLKLVIYDQKNDSPTEIEFNTPFRAFPKIEDKLLSMGFAALDFNIERTDEESAEDTKQNTVDIFSIPLPDSAKDIEVF